MRVDTRSIVPRITGYLKYRFAARALILMYHRVADLESDPQLLAVTPQRFAEQLEALRDYAQPLRLQDLVGKLREGALPRRAVIITFDDGYADNLYNAQPLLEHYGIPATVFVTSGHIGNRHEFWWDELDKLVLQPGTLPPRLVLQVGGNALHWEAGAATEYSEQDYQRYRGWDIEQEDDPGSRQRLYRTLYYALHQSTEGERIDAQRQIREWAGARVEGRSTHRTMSADEMVRLAAGGLVEVGAHTVCHPALAALPEAAQRDEIRRSKADLEEILNRPVTSFAYPHGAYTQQTLAIVRETGFTCACSSDADAVWSDANIFRLPRVVVRNWDGEAFACWLRGLFGG